MGVGESILAFKEESCCWVLLCCDQCRHIAIMAATSSNAGSATPSTFSYAQAAKGKSVSSATESTSQRQSIQGSSTAEGHDISGTDEAVDAKVSWADDAADAATVVGESESTKSRQPDDEGPYSHTSSMHASSDADALSVNANQERTLKSSSVSKDDGVNSPTSSKPHELPWRKTSQPPFESFDSTNTQKHSENGVDDASAVNENSTETPLVEAPPPPVNVWAQRAQLAKTTQPSARSQLAIEADFKIGSKRTSLPHSKPAPLGDASTDANRRKSELGATRSRSSLSQAIAASSSKEASKKDPPPNPSQFPSLQDSKTIAKSKPIADNGRRPSLVQRLEKTDEQESEKTNGSSSRPHGKQAWTPMPFTPTVVFETPIPVGSRRGGARFSHRGGRDNSRGGLHTETRAQNSPPTSGDSTNATPSRERSVSNTNRASSTLNKGKNGHAEKDGLANIAPRRDSVRDELHVLGVTSINSDASQNISSHVKDNNQPPSTLGYAASDAGGVGHTNGSTGTFPEGKPRRKNSRVNEPEPGFTRAGDRKRTSSINNSSKGGWYDRQAENGTRAYDQTRSQHGTLPFRDRGEAQVGRGRGTRHRGGGQQGHAPANIQINNNPVHWQGTPHSAKSATFNAPYPNASSTFPRSTNRGGAPRSASIPADANYGRIPPQYPGATAQSPYMGPGNDYNFVTPPGQMPQITPYMGHMMLMNGVASQLNYYFSVDNLCKDVFLRKHMDSQGFVSLRFIAEFARMRTLTTDFELIKAVAVQNPDFEFHPLADGNAYLRKKEGWKNFILDMNERDPSAQREGPPIGDWQTFSKPAAPLAVNDGRPNDPVLPHAMFRNNVPGFAPTSVTSPVNGFDNSPNNRHSLPGIEPASSFAPQPSAQPFQPPSLTGEAGDDDEPDAFPDESINNHLILFTRVLDEHSSTAKDQQSLPNGTAEDGNSKEQNGEEHSMSSASKLNGHPSRYAQLHMCLESKS